MKKILLLPAAVFPYTFCLCLAYGFVFRSFSDAVFQTLGKVSVATLALSIVCNLIFIFTTRHVPFGGTLRSALAVKMIHIPAYVAIFLLGLVMGLMFFMTFPFIMVLLFVDLLTLWISGMISVCAILKGIREKGACPTALLVAALICQFFWCADLISLWIVAAAKRRRARAA